MPEFCAIEALTYIGRWWEFLPSLVIILSRNCHFVRCRGLLFRNMEIECSLGREQLKYVSNARWLDSPLGWNRNCFQTAVRDMTDTVRFV